MTKFSLTLILFIITLTVFGQGKITQLTLETGNANTGLPIVGIPKLVTSNYHPFTSFGARFTWSKKGKHAWEQGVKLGYVYHRFVQHNIPLTTEIIYRYNFSNAFSMRTHLGIGYIHSISAAGRFQLNDLGEYEKVKTLGRAQAGVTFTLSAAYNLSENLQASMNVGILGQLPFVKSYVPLLPYNTIQIGIAKNILK